MVDTLPSRQEIEVIFNSCSNGDNELSPEQFKDLCYRLFLAPTNSDVLDLFRMYEKDKLSIDEVSSLIEKQWEPIAERKKKFIDDLRTCRKGSSGPLTRDELCEILTKGDEQNHDRLTEEDLTYVFQELSIHEDQLIDEEELTELIFKIEVALSRAQSRLTQHDPEEMQDNVDTGELEGQTQQSEAQKGELQQDEAQEGEQQQDGAQEGEQQQSETQEGQQAEETTDAQELGQTGETTDNSNENSEQAEGQTTESTQQQDMEQDVEHNHGENDNENAEQSGQEGPTEQTNDDDTKQESEETQGETTEQSTANEEEKIQEQSQNNVTDTQAENTETNELDSQQKSE